MAHTIEEAKSGRAACRTCKKPIAKGELRFGEEVPSLYSEGSSYLWHHVPCAATKKPKQLKEALAAFTGEVPDRAELEKTVEANAAKIKEKPSTFPYAERAPTSRSRCLECEEAIEKGTLRVAIEREVETGAMMTKSAGYLHPACAPAHQEDAELFEKVTKNSTTLTKADLEELEEELAG